MSGKVLLRSARFARPEDRMRDLESKSGDISHDYIYTILINAYVYFCVYATLAFWFYLLTQPD